MIRTLRAALRLLSRKLLHRIYPNSPRRPGISPPDLERFCARVCAGKATGVSHPGVQMTGSLCLRRMRRASVSPAGARPCL